MDSKNKLHLQADEFVMLRNFIMQLFGIYFDDDKQWLLESKLSRLMHRHDFNSFIEYYNFLMQRFYLGQAFTDPELVELVRAVSNNETYFFREAKALCVLTDHLMPELLQRQEPIKILSAGCSSGEEAYSIVIAMLQSRLMLTGSRARVIGVDVDSHVLNMAHEGVFKESAFRGISDPNQLRSVQAYFRPQPTPKGDNSLYKVKDMVKMHVEFHQCNLLDLNALQDLGPFDIIFCRNVLIYFSESGRKTAVENFVATLKKRGYLFLGHSESIIGKEFALKPVDRCDHIYYEKT